MFENKISEETTERYLFPKWTMEKQMEHKVVKKTEVKVEEAKSKKRQRTAGTEDVLRGRA